MLTQAIIRDALRAEREANEALKRLHEIDMECLRQRKEETVRGQAKKSSFQDNDDEEEEDLDA